MVMRSSPIRRITAGTSKTGWGTSVTPLMRQARMPAFRPKAWKKGFTTR